MKELSIEQKAKAYDEIIKKANKMHHENCEACQMCIEELFPELAESEDERIRKALITYFSDEDESYDGIPYPSILAWLEKQPIEGMSEFKEGDILYNKDSYASDSIFIFKGMSDKTNAYLCYARLYDKKDFSVYSKEDWDKGVGIYGGEFYPANHKQKELLFSKMEESGYRWNSDEKKMEKIEHKSSWSEKDSYYRNYIIQIIEEIKNAPLKRREDWDSYINWLKSLKDRVQPQPKQEWKQENIDDLTDFENAMMHIGNSFFGYNAGLDPNDTIAIKEQATILLGLLPRQEWSEEDEQTIKDVIILIEDGTLSKEGKEYYINKLKALRPQNRWKPSDEQMIALQEAMNIVGILTLTGSKINSLYQDLKKLKDEK